MKKRKFSELTPALAFISKAYQRISWFDDSYINNTLTRRHSSPSSRFSHKSYVGKSSVTKKVKKGELPPNITAKWIVKQERKPVTRASPAMRDQETGDILVKESPLI
ncbi:MAG: hypothetical protein ACXAEU_10580 [Candidatus Hodarchaeales archaeon]